MILHYLKPYGRSFGRNRINMLMAIGGFALGISVFVASLIFINNELKFDGFHQKKNSIYRIVLGESDESGSAYTSFVMGSILKNNFEDVRVVRFNNAGGMKIPTSYEDRKFTETRFYFTDPEFFEVFSFNLLKGDPATCLNNPFATVLTPAMAARYFGNEEPIGKSLKIDWAGSIYELEVTGIIDSPPFNSHLQFEFLISNATAEQIFTPKTFFTDWTANFCYNYLYIPKGRSGTVSSALQKIYTETVPQDQRSFNIRLQPLNRIHLYSKLMAENSRNSDILYVYIAASLCLLIITVSFINYVNIQLATYSKRLKELGVRKVLGANLSDIGLQFSTESTINFAIACAVALLFIMAVYPYFAKAINGEISSSSLLRGNLPVVASALSVLAILLVFCVVYVASRLKPTELVTGKPTLYAGQKSKNMLVGLQVGISILLIVGAIAINKQLAFLDDRNLGFDKEDVITVPYGRVITNKIDLVRAELVDEMDVKSVTLSSQIPPSNLNFKVPCFPEGGNPDGTAEPWNVAMVVIDEHFAETFNIDMKSGRSFSDEFRNDTTESFLINETFARQLNWNESIGKKIAINFNPGTGMVEHKTGRIVGVIKDFHFESLHKPISPILFIYKPTAFFFASFKLTPGNTQQKLERLKAKWSGLFPETPFDYYFVNKRLETLYKAERSWSANILLFTIIAVIISLFGMFSLVSFLVQSRQSEFAIRKVLGASGNSIIQLIGFKVIQIVFISFLVTVPICYLLVSSWLRTFAYKIILGIDVFLLALVSFLALCSIIILGNLLKASRTSIVEHLRSK